MELRFHKKELNCLQRIRREVSAQEVTQEVRLTEGMPDIGRVISAWGQTVIRSKEWRGDTVTVTGGVTVWILYAPEDGGEPRCADTWIPYQLRWERLDSPREGTVRISPLLRFADARALGPRKFMVRAGVAAMADALCPDKTDIYNAQELPEDIQVLRRTYPVRVLKETGEKTFRVDEELNVPGNQPEQILSYGVYPEITESRVQGNKTVFRGNGNLHLIYRCREGRIRAQDFEVPFSQFAELDASYSPDARADVWMGVTDLDLELTDEGQLRLKCDLVGQYLVDDREMVELIQDAYSPRRSVAVQTELLDLPAVLEEREESVPAEQVLAGHSGEAVDVRFLPDFPRQSRSGEDVELEMPGMFQILYYGEDGSLQSAIARWEGRQKIKAGEDTALWGLFLTAGQPQVHPGGEGLTVKASPQLQLQTTGGTGMPMVTELEAGEMQEPDPGRPSLVLCRAGGEGLWELAKRWGSTVDAIEKASGVRDPSGEDRMLLIPVS